MAIADRRRASHVDSVVQELHARFGSVVDLATIATQVEAEFAASRNVPITKWVPTPVTRHLGTNLGVAAEA